MRSFQAQNGDPSFHVLLPFCAEDDGIYAAVAMIAHRAHTIASSPSKIVRMTLLDVSGVRPSAWTVAVLGISSRQVLKLPIT